MAENANVQEPVMTQADPGSAGQNTQLNGSATTVDGSAAATGGVGAGNVMEVDVDKNLFEFESDDTPLMSLMLQAKKVDVKSPIVQHFMIDEERTNFKTSAALAGGTDDRVLLPVGREDRKMCQPYTTLRVRGVNGYSDDGQTETPGEDLQLFVVEVDKASGNPVVMAVNGKKANKTDAYGVVPAIPAGTIVDVLGNAMYETQQNVAPDSSVPVPQEVYLQKRGMSQIVSDYFDSQAKRIPFTQALLAERAIRKFKRSSNRTLWIGRKGHFQVDDAETGAQDIYFTEGVRWQFKREVQHTGRWTYEQFVALAKMYYTGADVPESAICLCGKNFLENIQCIDFSKHPEVKIDVKTNSVGWKITAITTVFGEIQFKREPTLDKIGYSNSAAIFGENRLVHYERTAEHTKTEKVQNHEAMRKSVIVWDALAMKGVCHLFINGEGTASASNAVSYQLWTEATAPAAPENGTVYYFTVDCDLGGGQKALSGQLWQYDGAAKKWNKYTGEVTL